ncbi:hypothetical protein EUGRSUZ_L00149 [Eucalyptus grandis]|uniref:Uncharacterized protein n=2 Tax=Eucalyptus grandis TaxID=71139 RepID=A0A058ZY89_EUCGR|nr:hypothetical protein EUGRSUZ_L00149 [Eucalyptus grandis]
MPCCIYIGGGFVLACVFVPVSPWDAYWHVLTAFFKRKESWNLSVSFGLIIDLSQTFGLSNYIIFCTQFQLRPLPNSS